ncbi:MAG: hypothetical protein ACTSRG_06090 [Candidatus Helarchaeota archaeon]
MIIHDLIVIRTGGMPLYTRKLDEHSLLKSGFYKAIYDFARQEDSYLSRIEFLNNTCAYCHYFEERDLLFFMTVDSIQFKDGIILKMERLYNEIFKHLEEPKGGDIVRDEEIINKVEDILLERQIKNLVLKKQKQLDKVSEEILKNPEIKAISVNSLDNTPIYFQGVVITKIQAWLQNWNLNIPPEPYKFEFGNYLDKKKLQGIIMNSGISLESNKNFLLYYIFGDAANLGFHMDWLCMNLNKIIGQLRL